MRLLALFFLASLPARAQLLDRVFSSNLSQEQAQAIGANASLEQKAAAMTPDQRQAAHGQLAAAEAAATTPQQLKEIARGYLILNEKAPNAGEDAVRLASRLIEENRADPDLHTLAAGGYFQQRNYEQSFIAAERALKRNPRDVVAQTLYMLSRDRRGALMTEDPGSVERRTEPPSPERSSESDKPIKPPMRMGRLQEVPALPIDDQPGQERMNWRERLEASLDSKAEAELAKADKAGKLSDKQRALALQYGKQGAKIGGVAGGGGLAAGGAWLCKGGGPKVMLGCAGAAGFFGMTLGSGLGAFIGVEVGIFQGADEKFTELWK